MYVEKRVCGVNTGSGGGLKKSLRGLKKRVYEKQAVEARNRRWRLETGSGGLDTPS